MRYNNKYLSASRVYLFLVLIKKTSQLINKCKYLLTVARLTDNYLFYI